MVAVAIGIPLFFGKDPHEFHVLGRGNGEGITIDVKGISQNPAGGIQRVRADVSPDRLPDGINANDGHRFPLRKLALGSGVEGRGGVQCQRFLCGGGSFLCNVDAIRLHCGVGDGRCVDGKVNIAGVQGIKRNPARSVQVNGLDVSPG